MSSPAARMVGKGALRPLGPLPLRRGAAPAGGGKDRGASDPHGEKRVWRRAVRDSPPGAQGLAGSRTASTLSNSTFHNSPFTRSTLRR